MLQKLSIKGQRNLNFKLFQWNLLSQCSYRCSYCYNTKIINEKESCWYDKNALTRVKELNDYFSSSGIPTYFEFFGGEPTLHGDIEKLVSEVNHPYILFSNLENFTKVKRLITKKLYAIFTSLHFEYNVDDTIKKITDLIQSDVIVHVNVMLENNVEYNKLIDYYLTVADIIKPKGGRATFRILDFYDSYLNNKYYSNFDFTKFKPYVIDEQLFTLCDKYKYSELDLVDNTVCFKTVQVKCDMYRYFLMFNKGRYYYCCSVDTGSSELTPSLSKEFVCTNNVCNRCDLRYGSKTGHFVSNGKILKLLYRL